jgi:hypothetical protein
VHEAAIEETPEGRVARDNGWLILNIGEMGWKTVRGFGTWCSFDARMPLRRCGLRVAVLGRSMRSERAPWFAR